MIDVKEMSSRGDGSMRDTSKNFSGTPENHVMAIFDTWKGLTEYLITNEKILFQDVLLANYLPAICEFLGITSDRSHPYVSRFLSEFEFQKSIFILDLRPWIFYAISYVSSKLADNSFLLKEGFIQIFEELISQLKNLIRQFAAVDRVPFFRSFLDAHYWCSIIHSLIFVLKFPRLFPKLEQVTKTISEKDIDVLFFIIIGMSCYLGHVNHQNIQETIQLTREGKKGLQNPFIGTWGWCLWILSDFIRVTRVNTSKQELIQWYQQQRNKLVILANAARMTRNGEVRDFLTLLQQSLQVCDAIILYLTELEFRDARELLHVLSNNLKQSLLEYSLTINQLLQGDPREIGYFIRSLSFQLIDLYHLAQEADLKPSERLRLLRDFHSILKPFLRPIPHTKQLEIFVPNMNIKPIDLTLQTWRALGLLFPEPSLIQEHARFRLAMEFDRSFYHQFIAYIKEGCSDPKFAEKITQYFPIEKLKSRDSLEIIRQVHEFVTMLAPTATSLRYYVFPDILKDIKEGKKLSANCLIRTALAAIVLLHLGFTFSVKILPLSLLKLKERESRLPREVSEGHAWIELKIPGQERYQLDFMKPLDNGLMLTEPWINLSQDALTIPMPLILQLDADALRDTIIQMLDVRLLITPSQKMASVLVHLIMASTEFLERIKLIKDEHKTEIKQYLNDEICRIRSLFELVNMELDAW